MQSPVSFDEKQRQVSAAAVEASVYRIAKYFDLTVERCVWNCDTGMDHCGPHRLDIHVSGLSVRTYIKDAELAAYWGRLDTGETDVRLYHLLSGLHEVIEERVWGELPQHCWTPMTRNICINPGGGSGSKSGSGMRSASRAGRKSGKKSGKA